MLSHFMKPTPELLRAFREGEEWAFDALYRRYEKAVLRYVDQLTGGDDAGPDLVQEVFLKVHRFRADYDPKYAFSTWLWQIARNTVLDWQRKSRPESAAIDPEEGPACPRPDAEALLARKGERRVLRDVIRNLTGLQRRVIWLRVIHQLSYGEISRRLGLSLSAVKCLVYRSKQALKPVQPGAESPLYSPPA
jgi:RNA polymerase sigma-70 factor (ECF subfamily)